MQIAKKQKTNAWCSNYVQINVYMYFLFNQKLNSQLKKEFSGNYFMAQALKG